MSYGITNSGFKSKPINVIISELRTAYKLAYGEDIDLSPTSVLALAMEIDAAKVFELFQSYEELFFSQFISTGSGTALDEIGSEIGIDRKLATKSKAVLSLQSSTVTEITVPAETILSTTDGIGFKTLANGTIKGGLLQDSDGNNDFRELKHIGAITASLVKDYLPAPYNLNNLISILTVSDFEMGDAILTYPDSGSVYIYAGNANGSTGVDGGKYSYGLTDNVIFYGKTTYNALAYLEWQTSTRNVLSNIRQYKYKKVMAAKNKVLEARKDEPPTGNVVGDKYLIIATATGAFSSEENDIAICDTTTDGTAATTSWTFYYGAGAGGDPSDKDWVHVTNGREHTVFNNTTLLDTGRKIGDGTNLGGGQLFVGTASDLSYVNIYLRKVLLPTGNVVAKLYPSDDTGDPNNVPDSGDLKATSDTVDVSTISTSYEFVKFTFSTPFTMIADDYFICVEYEGGNASNYLEWGVDTGSGFASSNYAVENPQTTWTANSDDGLFEIFVTDSSDYYYDTNQWEQESPTIINKIETTAPATPTIGDRYVIAGVGSGWANADINDIVRANNTNGTQTTSWDIIPPIDGEVVYINEESESNWYDLTGDQWNKISVTPKTDNFFETVALPTTSSTSPEQELFGQAGYEANQYGNESYIYIGSDKKFTNFTVNMATNTETYTFDETVDITRPGENTIIVLEYRSGNVNSTWENDGNWSAVATINVPTGDTSLSTIFDTENISSIINLNFLEAEWNNWILSVPDDLTLSQTQYYYMRLCFRDITADGGASPVVSVPIVTVTIDNGIIPATSQIYYIGIIGNQWENFTTEANVAGINSNVLPETITVVNSSVSGVSGVINVSAATGGEDKETDAGYTIRMTDYPRTFWSADSIESRVNSLTGIDSATVISGNKTNEVFITSNYINPPMVVFRWDDSLGTDYLVDETQDASSDTANDVIITDGDANDYLLIGSISKFTRIRITYGTKDDGNIIAWKFLKDSATPETLTGSNIVDNTNGFSSATGVYNVILQLSPTQWGNWVTNTYQIIDGSNNDPDTTGRYFISIGFDGISAANISKIEIFNESVILNSRALNPGSHNGIKRVQIEHTLTDTQVNLTSEQDDQDNHPALTASTEYWCDYLSPSTVFFYTGAITSLDFVRVDFTDNTIGGQFIQVTVLPTSSPITSELFNSVYTTVQKNIAIGTGFEIIEAGYVSVTMIGALDYDTVNYTISSLNTLISTQLTNNYFNSLVLGSDLLRNEVIFHIMSVDGVIDIQELYFKVILEEYDYNDIVQIAIIMGKIYAYGGEGDYSTSMTVSTQGDDIYDVIAYENDTDKDINYTIEAPSATYTNGRIIFVGTAGLTSDSTFKFTYYSKEGNLTPAETIVNTLQTVAFT